MIKKWFNWCFNILPHEGTPCLIIAKEGVLIGVIDGLITTNLKNALEINYRWLDGTMHTFIVKEDNYVGLMEGKPLYRHGVGQLFGEGTEQEFGSEFLYKIVRSDIGTQMLKGLDEMREDKELPWVKIGIIVGVIVLAAIAYQSGALDPLIGDFLPKRPEQIGQ